jgi:hypothetical protein
MAFHPQVDGRYAVVNTFIAGTLGLTEKNMHTTLNA